VTDAALYPGERILVSEAAAAYGALDAAFLLEPLAYYPDTAGARADARSWTDPGFPILIREPPVPLRRGDALADGALDLSDAVACWTTCSGTEIQCRASTPRTRTTTAMWTSPTPS